MSMQVVRFRIQLLVLALVVGPAASASAATVNLAGTLDAAQETSCAMTSTAQGSATATLDDVTGALAWTITFGNNSPSFNNGTLDFGAELFSHFHGPALPGATAGVKLTLANGSPKVASTTVASASDRTDIKNGLWYVNIHSAGCGGGEIRGQIVRVPSCGDGIVDAPGEHCDDGNVAGSDGCDASCFNEPPPPVPAMSGTGAVLFALLAITLASLVLRRRARAAR
ncbi:MAG: CHRD domain-containing protein [Deltaproteobacteria bacterium]|nr:CHRD domain-containing protein [Deltaproteobacteria bacterium]